MSGANLPDQDDTERIEMSEAEHPLLSLPATPGRTPIQNAGVHVNRILDCPKCGGRIRRSPRSFSLSVLPEEAPLRSDSDSSIAERHPEEEALPEPDTPPNSPEVTTGTDPQPLPCRCGKRRVSVSSSLIIGLRLFGFSDIVCSMAEFSPTTSRCYLCRIISEVNIMSYVIHCIRVTRMEYSGRA